MAQRHGVPTSDGVAGSQEPYDWVFDAFRVDPREARLWRGDAVLPLHAKAFAVLCCLVTQAGQLVTKDAMLEAVWPETAVSEAVLHVAIREVRQVLGDPARTPRFIETVHGRGYRFLAPVRALASPSGLVGTGLLHSFPSVLARRPRHFVGRDAELTRLAQWWTTARQGTRQVGIIAGEPGIGKTALVDTFVAQVAAREDLWIGHGQCIDQYGAGEAYLPVLEALGRLGHGPEGAALLPVLRQYAPSWLVHLPALLTSADREALGRTTSGITPARMLRELADVLEVLTAVHPLILVLEDLHWSDHATLAWLAYMARRPDPACVLILGTYRPVEVIVEAHPLRRMLTELRHHGLCTELVLDYLSEAAVTAYLAQYFGATPLPAGLAHVLHRHTHGNPLFLRAVVEELLARHLLEEVHGQWYLLGARETITGIVPESLRRLIEQQIEHCSTDEQALLDAASVAGSTFTAAAIAAGVAQPEDLVDRQCATWARHGRFVHAAGIETWPDGTVTAGYSFVHALYHEVVYRRVADGHRVQLHRRIGLRKEAGYGAQAETIAAELAQHFAQGRDTPRAMQYLRQAADMALHRYANTEAITHLTQGLALLRTLSETPERTQQELELLLALGPALMAAKGYGAPEVERTYAQALALCQQMGDTLQLFPALVGLHRFYVLRGELEPTRALGARLLTLAQEAQDPARLVTAHYRQGVPLFFQGAFACAHTHLTQALALYNTQRSRAHILLHGDDAGVGCLAYAALALWLLGYAAQARERLQAALTLARTLAHPFSLAYVLISTGWFHHWHREAQATRVCADEAIALSRAHELPLREAQGMILRGWALAREGPTAAGIAQMHQGLAALRATGTEVNLTYYLSLVAEACGQGGQTDEGLCVLAEALTRVQSGRECWWEAELHRLRGVLLLRHERARHNVMAAAQAFQHALTLARHQQAKALELRAATSLSRLWQQGKRDDARSLLAPIYGWFTEGFDTADLQEAKALLEELRE